MRRVAHHLHKPSNGSEKVQERYGFNNKPVPAIHEPLSGFDNLAFDARGVPQSILPVLLVVSPLLS